MVFILVMIVINILFHEMPFITSIHSMYGHVSGDTTIAVNGNYFSNNEVNCYLDDNIITITYINTTQIQCITPILGSSETVSLVIKDSNGYQSITHYFIYQEELQYDSIYSTYGTPGSTNFANTLPTTLSIYYID